MTSLEWMGMAGLLALHAVFAAVEAAWLAANRLRLRHLVKSGYPHGGEVEALLQSAHPCLGVLRVGGALVRALLLLGFVAVGDGREGTWPGWGRLAAGVVLMTFVGDALPRAWSQRRPIDRLVRFRAVLRWAEWLARRVTRIVGRATSRSTPEGRKDVPLVTRESLEGLIRDGVGTGAISPVERAMIVRVLGLRQRPASEAMVPIGRVATVSTDTPLGAFFQKARESGFIRMPVRDAASETFVGIVNVFYVVGQTVDLGRCVGEFMRPPLFVPEQTPVSDLLPRMRRNRQPMALVRAADGTVVGAVTLDDVLEAVVGPALPEDVRNPLPQG